MATYLLGPRAFCSNIIKTELIEIQPSEHVLGRVGCFCFPIVRRIGKLAIHLQGVRYFLTFYHYVSMIFRGTLLTSMVLVVQRVQPLVIMKEIGERTVTLSFSVACMVSFFDLIVRPPDRSDLYLLHFFTCTQLSFNVMDYGDLR